MSTSYTGLIPGNICPIDFVALLQASYGGSNYRVLINDGKSMPGNYQIVFNENPSPPFDTMSNLQRIRAKYKPVTRTMHFNTNGSCACDYAEISDRPMTLFSLGHHGHYREIILALVRLHDGWINDDLVEQRWVKASEIPEVEAELETAA